MFQLFPSQGSDLPEINALLDAGFGPARHNRTAYRLRDGATPDPALSFVARDGAALVGSVQCWAIGLRIANGRPLAADDRLLPMVLLGPVATDAARRGEGIATALMESALAAVDATCQLPVLLIGDSSFYGRFGFSAAPTQGWTMPGPVDHARLLLRWSGVPLPLAGRVEGKDGLRRAA